VGGFPRSPSRDRTGEKYFIRHVQSLSLTLGPATERVIKDYAAICDYFLKHLLPKKHEKNDNYRRICACLKDKNTITKLKFVASLANIFEPFLKLFQTEGPIVYILHDECCSLVRRVFVRYLKEDMLDKRIKEVDYKKRDNQLPNSEVKRGAAASEKMPAELEIKAMRECYVTISKYLISHLPIDDDILEHLEILYPLMQHQHGTTRRLKKLIAAVPHILTDIEVDSALVRVDSIYTRRYT